MKYRNNNNRVKHLLHPKTFDSLDARDCQMQLLATHQTVENSDVGEHFNTKYNRHHQTKRHCQSLPSCRRISPICECLPDLSAMSILLATDKYLQEICMHGNA